MCFLILLLINNINSIDYQFKLLISHFLEHKIIVYILKAGIFGLMYINHNYYKLYT